MPFYTSKITRPLPQVGFAPATGTGIAPPIQIQAQPGGLAPQIQIQPQPGGLAPPIQIQPPPLKKKTWFEKNWMLIAGVGIVGLILVPMLTRRRRGR